MLSTDWLSEDELLASISTAASARPGGRTLIVTNLDGQHTSRPDAFTVVERATPPPDLLDVSPESAPQGPTVELRLHGRNIAPGATASVGSLLKDAPLLHTLAPEGERSRTNAC